MKKVLYIASALFLMAILISPMGCGTEKEEEPAGDTPKAEGPPPGDIKAPPPSDIQGPPPGGPEGKAPGEAQAPPPSDMQGPPPGGPEGPPPGGPEGPPPGGPDAKGPPPEPPTHEEFVKMHDKNGDGVVSMEEFVGE